MGGSLEQVCCPKPSAASYSVGLAQRKEVPGRLCHPIDEKNKAPRGEEAGSGRAAREQSLRSVLPAPVCGLERTPRLGLSKAVTPQGLQLKEELSPVRAAVVQTPRSPSPSPDPGPGKCGTQASWGSPASAPTHFRFPPGKAQLELDPRPGPDSLPSLFASPEGL